MGLEFIQNLPPFERSHLRRFFKCRIWSLCNQLGPLICFSGSFVNFAYFFVHIMKMYVCVFDGVRGNFDRITAFRTLSFR